MATSPLPTLPFRTLPGLIQYIEKNFENPRALGYKKGTQWQYLSTDAFCSAVRQAALGLIEMGLKPGGKVGLMANPSPFWIILDQAILSAGGVSVPMFANISPENLAYEVKESEIKMAVVEDEEQLKLLESHRKAIEHFIVLNGSPDGAVSYGDLLSRGEKKDAGTLEAIQKEIEPGSTATIIYTSGSTGAPKGVELTHHNLVSQIAGAGSRFPLDTATDKALSALPLAHVFERMVTLYYLSTGITVCFAEDVKKIGDNLRETKPTIITLVPRLLEKVLAKMQSNVQENTGFKKWLGSRALERALSKPYNDPKNIQDALYDKLVYKKFREALGGNVRLAISGSAPLAPELCNFFLNIGFPIYEGYGCTETSPVISANYPDHRVVGTVGLVFPGIEMRIAEDGEIITRGPHVMKSYYKKPKETKEVIDDDGWYHTGDLGKMEGEYLKITGRKKELFKTANGKYVAPVPIESSLVRLNEMLDMAMVIAEKRKFTSCIVFPDFENLNKHKEAMQLSYMSHGEFLDSPQFKEKVQATVDAVNEKLNHWEKIQRFVVAGNPPSIDTGELTPTMKLRRHVVEEQFKDTIEALYNETSNEQALE